MFETGVGIRNPLFFVGIIENNIDPRYESRVQVRAFGVHGTKDQIPTEDLPWALVVAGNYNMNSLPQQNHWVFGVFLDGRDAQQPLILGTIPTFMSDVLSPERDGIGQRPRSEDEKVQSADTAPERLGQPQNHGLARGEYIQEHYPLEQELNRIKNIRVGSNPSAPNENFSSWSEPGTAYNAKYPHNRVYDSPDGKTTIELDSTPGSERLMVWHRGSFIQIDSNGTRTDKSYSDHYEVNDRNNMVYIGGRSSVTIMGDSHVYVDGNKTEEINGDLIQIVHGNHILGVGGQSTLNASEEVQIRGAQLRMESNVSGINLKAAKGLFAETGESMHFKSGIAIFQEATNSFNMKAGDNIFIQCDSTLNLKAENTNIEANDIMNLKAFDARIGNGAFVSIEAAEVAIDDVISMANGDATAPGGASDATEADTTKAVEAPEPPAKSTSISTNNSGRNRPNVGSAGVGAVDDQTDTQSNNNVSDDFGNSLSEDFSDITTNPASTNISVQEKGILNAIAAKESGGDYAVLNGGSKFDTSKSHPNVVGPGGTSTAAGRYQFTYGTWLDMHNGNNPPMTPENQDRAALKLARQRYKAYGSLGSFSTLDDYVDANGVNDAVLSHLSRTWEAFASSQGRKESINAYNNTINSSG